MNLFIGKNNFFLNIKHALFSVTYKTVFENHSKLFLPIINKSYTKHPEIYFSIGFLAAPGRCIINLYTLNVTRRLVSALVSD